MDAEYLQKNIIGPLSEAMASMAVKTPDDEVEYIGNYLLKYVERKQQEERRKDSLASAEEKFSEYNKNQDVKQKQVAEVAAELFKFDSKVKNFATSLHFMPSKTLMMNSLVDFIENDLSIPASYIALKKVVGDVETLHYLVASNSQQHVLGKKLVKVSTEEGDDAPTRQGISFEAFKLPEVPEEEATEEAEEGGELKPPKPAPKASPLIVVNAMREQRCKFFGIPKLGAYVALPFTYDSIDHENGCVFNPGDSEAGVAPSYNLIKAPSQFIIGIDTIGKFRQFKPEEIERVNMLGESLVKAFEKVEEAVGAEHLEFINGTKIKEMAEAVTAITAKIPEDEARVIGEVGAALAANPPVEGADPLPGADLLKPYKEAEQVVLDVWNPAVGTGPIADAIQSLDGYILPLPTAVLSLFYVIASLLQFDLKLSKDVCDELSWSQIKKNVLPLLPERLSQYKPSAPNAQQNPTEMSIKGIKAFAETTNILADASIYPANLPVFPLLMSWLQKAIAAREAAIAYFTEAPPEPWTDRPWLYE